MGCGVGCVRRRVQRELLFVLHSHQTVRFLRLATENIYVCVYIYIYIFFFFLSFFVFVWLCFAACRILVPIPGFKPVPSAMEVCSLSHWTTGEVPSQWILFIFQPSNNCLVFELSQYPSYLGLVT